MSVLRRVLSLFGLTRRELEPVRTKEQATDYYYKGTKLIGDRMDLDGRKVPKDGQFKASLHLGIDYLKAVSVYSPTEWKSLWFVGMAHKTLREWPEAHEAFRRAREVNGREEAVLRELGIACSHLNRFDEAVEATQAAIAYAPDNPGLHSNLAVNLLMAGEIERALVAVTGALNVAPDDPITRNVKKIIDDVRSGARPLPKSQVELTRKWP